MTIARHFNAGLNPQAIQVSAGRPEFSKGDNWQSENRVPSIQTSRWDERRAKIILRWTFGATGV
jgi:hypothetical protein